MYSISTGLSEGCEGLAGCCYHMCSSWGLPAAYGKRLYVLSPQTSELMPTKNGRGKKADDPVFYSPGDLDLVEIGPRSHVFQRCGKDIVVFMNAGDLVRNKLCLCLS